MSKPQVLAWAADSPAGPLDITINLAKPEKDPRDIAQAAEPGSATGAGGDCVLCWQRAADGSLTCAGAGGGAVQPVRLGDEEWAWWFSPYGYFPEHVIVSAPVHRPMAIDRETIGRLIDFADAYPQWFIGSNADLPIVGGSLLAHDHFQGGGYRFPLMKAPVRRHFALLEAAGRVLEAWRTFVWEPSGIRPWTDEPGDAGPSERRYHNTANPILWREGDEYVMDLVLRNNRTTSERPYGLFHVPERLFHIKKENIGLIEIMGRAILPGRLAAELPEVRPVCDAAYYEILQAAGVFKDDERGRAGWAAFIATL